MIKKSPQLQREGPIFKDLRLTSVDLWRFESIKIFRVKLTEIVILLKLLCLDKGHSLVRVQYPKYAYGPYMLIESILKWCIYLTSLFS